MSHDISALVYPVRDIKRAKVFYSKFLEAEPYVDSAYYVGYRVGEMEIGLDPNARVGPIAYTDVEDIRRSLKSMTEAGGQVVQDARDVGGGLLIAQVKDADGNTVGFRQFPDK